LAIPPVATGIVICSGSRSGCAGEMIRDHGNATLRLQLLTAEEQREDKATHAFSFAVPLMARRLIAVTRWLAHEPATARFGFGYFGEEIAGPAALIAAAELGVVIDAVVCRHARPDFAANALPKVEAATMLICCQSNPEEVVFNRTALNRLKCEKQLQVLPPPCRPDKGERRDCVGCSLAASWFKTFVRGR
jgi:putative phosphoribosyl transferase